jgi:porphobilinogen synthase
LYEPFRASVGSKKALGSADKRSYQMDLASNFQISLEASADVKEGADILLVKPGLHYLDVIAKLAQSYDVPIWSYHVSGECALIHLAAENQIASFEKILYEALIAQKRAGAHKIITYYALEAAQLCG